MTQKELGYVELEWTCKRCKTKNPGGEKVCAACGGPMEADDQFSLPEQQKLIEDAKKLEKAGKGADRLCPYCGAPNPADAAVCSQCQGDLKTAQARQAGQVLGAFENKAVAQVPCRHCGQPVSGNPARCPNCGGSLAAPPAASKPVAPPTAKQSMPTWLIVLLGLLGVCCVGVTILGLAQGLRTTDMVGQVQSLAWERTIEILAEQPVEKGDWQEDVPQGAMNVVCADKYRETRSEPAPKSTEVCGTPYTIDQGDGTGKVVQDCEYRVYASYCEFEVLEWVVVEQARSQGRDARPQWPSFNLAAGEREGDRRESYTVTFAADGDTYSYSPGNEAEFAQFTPGSEWTLTVNGFGVVTGVER